MSDTKEAILIAALHLFARDGYEAVSVSQIAGALSMTKGALYKHYKNKRDIFDHIVARMEQMDAEQAETFQLPEGTLEGRSQRTQSEISEWIMGHPLSSTVSIRTEDILLTAVTVSPSALVVGV